MDGMDGMTFRLFCSTISGMGYTSVELTEMLAEVKAAISKVLRAQEYATGAQLSVRRAMLRDLHERERWLLAELDAAGGSVDTGFDPVNRVEFSEPL